MKDRDGALVNINIWPFLPTSFDDSPPGSAWPHGKGKFYGPLLAYFYWNKKDDDEFWIAKMKEALANLQEVAFREGCTTKHEPIYSNNALEDTPVGDIYKENLEWLGRVRAEYDPSNAMDRTGGFKIPVGS